MSAAYVIITVITIAANAWAFGADLVRATFILVTMDEVGVPGSWLLPLGILKAAGAAGLLLGLLGVRPLGIAAAFGLVLFFAGAITTHVRARALRTIAYPVVYFGLALASAALAIAARPF